MSYLSEGYALLGYGETVRWGVRRSPDTPPLPAGEGDPPLEHWLIELERCVTEAQIVQTVRDCWQELEAWRRRPEPPPEGETAGDLRTRILIEGEGWEAKDVARAMRCTPTLVRNVRVEAERNAETGRPDGTLQNALGLLARGMSLRQAAVLTGIPKSTIYDAARRAA